MFYTFQLFLMFVVCPTLPGYIRTLRAGIYVDCDLCWIPKAENRDWHLKMCARHPLVTSICTPLV